MATAEQIAGLIRFRDAAKRAGHIWPEYAACEAALESNWGASELAVKAHNLFGQKQAAPPTPPRFGTINLPTQEWSAGHWETIVARWIVFPSESDCFRERMEVLESLKVFYPQYAQALAAASGEEFIRLVSERWSTDPQRADKVLAIYAIHKDVLEAPAHA